MLWPLPFETLVPLQPPSFCSSTKEQVVAGSCAGCDGSKRCSECRRGRQSSSWHLRNPERPPGRVWCWHQSTERNLGLLKGQGACGRTEMPAQLLAGAQGLWPAERGELTVLGFTRFLPECIDLVFWQFLDLYLRKNIVLTLQNTYQRREMVLYLTSRSFF